MSEHRGAAVARFLPSFCRASTRLLSAVAAAALLLAPVPHASANDPGDADNDGLAAGDPCPGDARNRCFGVVALDPFTGRPLRINANTSSTIECAGDKIDCNGELWTEDTGFNLKQKPPRCNLGGGEELCVISGITDLFGCEDETTEDLFQCGHSVPPPATSLVYDFDVDDGEYLVNLFFGNTFDGTAAVGDRVFDIIVEGVTEYPAFDQVAAAGGSGIAVVRSVLATVNDGNGLTIELASIEENASIKAIEVLGSDAGTCSTTVSCGPASICNPVTGLCDLRSGFSDDLVVAGLRKPTSLTFLPDGRLLLLEKNGDVLIIDPSQSPAAVSEFIEIPDVLSTSEAGLLDLTLDPDFASNGFVYFYYAHDSNDRHRISRFTSSGNTANPATELMLWEDDEPVDACCHYGGGLDFGPDGMLYMTLGDKFDPDRAQDMTIAAGKIIRLMPDGTIPTDNPFYDGAGPNYDAMWALGLRNPFRARFDDPTGRMLMGDLGLNTIESINVGVEGANYGWPDCEGTCPDTSSEYVSPIYEFLHIGGGHGIMGGIVYRGSQFPGGMNGAYFFGDHAAGWIRYLTFDGGSTDVTHRYDFLSDIGDVVAIEQAPDGSLYYIVHDGELRRVSFSTGNQPPAITNVSVAPTSGTAPLEVSFSAAADDPEDDPLSYRWFFGDGEEATGPNAVHTYTDSGAYDAQVLVSDPTHDVLSTPVRVSVGGAPTATILTPTPGQTFRAGETISFSGEASDPDETLGGNDMSWEVVLIHADHEHPRQGPDAGESGSYTPPTVGHAYGDQTALEIRLTVTDSSGLSDTATVQVLPQLVDVGFDTDPSGIAIAVDGVRTATPAVIDEATGFTYEIEADASVCLGLTEYDFDAWSDGGARIHTISVGEQNETFIATYTAGESCAPAGDPDNDGLADGEDPCPADALNACFGPVAREAGSNRPVRLNAGPSPAQCAGARTDCRGTVWEADFGAEKGSVAALCNLGENNTCAVTGVEDIFGCSDSATADLIECGRSGETTGSDISYFFVLQNGTYLINLLFANTDRDAGLQGDAVFDVIVEGRLLFGAFDPIEASGATGRAAVRSAIIDVNDGNGLSIVLSGSGSLPPQLQGIEVLEGCDRDSDCSDGEFCNGVETCDTDGICRPGTPVSVDDGIACTVDACDEADDMIRHVPDDGRCDDDDPCNGEETCTAGSGCIPGADLDCDDGVSCTDDTCDASAGGCVHTPIDAACDDGNECNGTEMCDPESGCSVGTLGCSAFDGPCAVGVCVGGACQAQPIAEGESCEDGNACTTGNICESGVCLAETACGVPVSRRGIPVVSDALFALRAALSLDPCPACECDVNSDGRITVSDAFAIVSLSVGLSVDLNCFVPLGATSTLPTSNPPTSTLP